MLHLIWKYQKAFWLSCLYLFGLAPPMYAQSGAAKSLEVGNRWIYSIKDDDNVAPRKQSETVVGDTMIANRTYAIVARDNRFNLSPFERADTSTIRAFVPHDSSEHIVCDFTAEVGDTTGQFLVVNTGLITFWGRPRRFIRYYYEFSYLSNRLVEFVEGIGVTYEALGGLAGSGFTKKLIGAVLDEQIYGDTTLTRVIEQSPAFPSAPYLLPSYPNPFNRETVIHFHVPNGRLSRVVVEIYDMAGRSVATLFNQQVLDSEYRIKWGGSNQEGRPLTNGVYLCRLSAERVHQVQKVLLLR